VVVLAVAAFAGAVLGEAARAATSAFAPIPAGARTWGMAGNGAVLADDAYATLANPARLAFLEGRQAVAGYGRLVEDLSNDRILAAFGLPVGADITSPGQRGRVHTAAFGLAVEYQGLELAQGSGYGEIGITGAVAWAPFNIAALGGGVRYLQADSDLDGVSASGVALDLGFTMALHPEWELAFVYRNLAGSVTFEGAESEALGHEISLASAWTRNDIADVEGEIVWESSQAYWGSLGVEVEAFHVLALRAGTRRWFEPEARTIPALGLGVLLGGVRIDYGARFDDVDALGVTHQASLGARF
jgi:hypothetical protein